MFLSPLQCLLAPVSITYVCMRVLLFCVLVRLSRSHLRVNMVRVNKQFLPLGLFLFEWTSLFNHNAEKITMSNRNENKIIPKYNNKKIPEILIHIPNLHQYNWKRICLWPYHTSDTSVVSPKIPKMTTNLSAGSVRRQSTVTSTTGTKQLQQLFSKTTKAIVWGMQTRAVQSMLDFDFICR